MVCPAAIGQLTQITYPSPYWDYSPITPRVGDVVTFDASDFYDSWNAKGESTIVTLVWQFGDGGSATGSLVTHRFSSPGTFRTGVTATDDRGYGGTSEYDIEVREGTQVAVYLSFDDGPFYTGQEVTIGGNLTFNGAGVPDESVALQSKTYVEGSTWIDIATVKTDGRGKFSAVWKSVYGYYQIRALWAGNSTYPESSISDVLIVQGFGNLVTGFSSNSTITGLNFNSTTRILDFTAEGPSGTRGFVNITLERDPSFEPEGVSVLMDGRPIEYGVDSVADSWILFFSYSHSLHKIIIDLSGHGASESAFPWLPVAAVSVVVFAVVAVAAVVYLKKRGVPRVERDVPHVELKAWRSFPL